MKTLCLLLVGFALNAGLVFAADVAPAVGPRINSAPVAEWQAQRFGLFIHWGPVSLKGTEIGWSRGGERRGFEGRGNQVPVQIYDNLYREFNPTNFNAHEWVAIAQAAGMKYLVFTSRHHDGFSLFDTQVSDYKLTSPLSPFRRDVVKELADACHAAGLKFGVYYSQPDWHHPDAFTPDRHTNYLAYLKAQVRELLSNYGRVDILWFDGLNQPAAEYDGVAINQMARALQPHLLINNRNGEREQPEDFDTPEQLIGKYQDQRAWESCITICRQWAWKPNDQMKSLKECLHTLISCAGGDGNLLFNVGPMPDGRIEPRQVGRLKEMGAWLAKNGESIYGTRGGPWMPTKEIASTRQGNTVFLHLLRTDDGRVELPELPRRVKSAALLHGGAVRFAQAAGQLQLTLDSTAIDPVDTVVRLELDGSAMDLAAVAIPAKTNTALVPVGRLEQDSYNWDERHAQVLEMQKPLDPEIVLIGDSITHFWGGPPASRQPRGTNAWAATFGDRRVLNLGFGWDRTQNVLWRLDHGELDGTRPKVVVLNIGSNNFSETRNARANTPAEIAEAILAICARVHQKSPASRIIVMGVLPRGFNPADRYRTGIAALNELLARQLAGRPQITFLDISEQLVARDAVLPKDIMSDGVHPTEAGYAIWGRALVAAGVLQ